MSDSWRANKWDKMSGKNFKAEKERKKKEARARREAKAEKRFTDV